MVKAKLRSGKDKGGCLIGKKEKSTPGGCKVGRKGVNAKAKAPAKPKAPMKPKAKAPAKPKAKAPAKPKSPGQIEAARIKAKNKRPKKKEGARVVNKKPSSGIAKIPPKEAKGVMKSKAEKKARIQKKVRDLGKAQIAKKKQKKKDYTSAAEKKARIQAKVAKLGKDKVKEKRAKGRATEKLAKKLKIHPRYRDAALARKQAKAKAPAKAVSRESSAEEIDVEEVFHNGKRYFKDDSGKYYDPSTEEQVPDPTKTKAKAKAKAKAPAKAKGKAKAEPSKVLSSVKLGGEGMDLPDLYKHGIGNASKAELGNMLDKMGKDINAEIKKMKTADRAYFKVVKVRGGTEYHTDAANIMNQEQQEVQKALERYVKTHGIRDPGVQEMIGKFNKQARSAVNRMRKAKGDALERLGFI